MLPINKKEVPGALLKATGRIKTTPDATLTWKNLDAGEKREVLLSLIEEQGSLCAYCMRKIKDSDAHVEHYIPQSKTVGLNDSVSVDYQNLLAVCDGFEGSEAGLTCDRARGNASLKVNPLREETLRSICYRRNGVIYAKNEEIDTDLDKTLNLNQKLLVRNRKEALQALVRKLDQLGRRKGPSAVRGYCERYVASHLKYSDLRVPYDGIVLYFMKKRLRSKD